jgi:hypothetical protein
MHPASSSMEIRLIIVLLCPVLAAHASSPRIPSMDKPTRRLINDDEFIVAEGGVNTKADASPPPPPPPAAPPPRCRCRRRPRLRGQPCPPLPPQPQRTRVPHSRPRPWHIGRRRSSARAHSSRAPPRCSALPILPPPTQPLALSPGKQTTARLQCRSSLSGTSRKSLAKTSTPRVQLRTRSKLAQRCAAS